MTSPQPPVKLDLSEIERLETYDAGLLNDFGGGNVEWWQDYIRAELGRAHDFYVERLTALLASARREETMREALIQQRAWVQHWQKDRAHDLKPTEGSLSDALVEINSALATED